MPQTSPSHFQNICPHVLQNYTQFAPNIVFTIPSTLPHISTSQFHQLCPHFLQNYTKFAPNIVIIIPPNLPKHLLNYTKSAPHTVFEFHQIGPLKSSSQFHILFPKLRPHNSTKSVQISSSKFHQLCQTPSSKIHQLCPRHRLHSSTNSAPNTVFTIPTILPQTSSSQFHQLCTKHRRHKSIHSAQTPSSKLHQICPKLRLYNSTKTAPITVFTIPTTLPQTSSSQFHQHLP